MTKDNRRAASPVQAGIDPLVKKAIKQLWPNSLLGPKNLTELIVFIEEERECEAEYRRSQAERIAALEALEKDTSTKFFSEHEQRIAAESLLAEAREALEKCQSALVMLVTPTNEVQSGVGIKSAWAICMEAEAVARATLSRLKPGEKGGEA